MIFQVTHVPPHWFRQLQRLLRLRQRRRRQRLRRGYDGLAQRRLGVGGGDAGPRHRWEGQEELVGKQDQPKIIKNDGKKDQPAKVVSRKERQQPVTHYNNNNIILIIITIIIYIIFIYIYQVSTLETST
jgi:hypothetical protein